MCNRVLANASYECRRSLLLSGSESCKIFTVIWFDLEVEFSWERVSLFRYTSITQQWILVIYRYLTVQVTLIAFATRFATLSRHYAFIQHFWALLRCTCAAASSSSIQSSTSVKIVFNCCFNIYPIDHRVLLQVCLFTISRNKLLLYESCLLDVFARANSRVLVASFNLHINVLLPL